MKWTDRQAGRQAGTRKQVYAVDSASRHARQATECQRSVICACNTRHAWGGLVTLVRALGCRKALKKAMDPKVAGQEAAELARYGRL